MPNDIRQSIYDILRDLRGLDGLKQLFWSELGYEQERSQLSRRGWADTATNALTENPLLFAAGGNREDFHVLYARLNSDRLLLGLERPVISALLNEHPYALFVFSNAKQDHWHFVNVKYDTDVKRRKIYRRIAIGPYERLRTASERIAMLDVDAMQKTLFGLDALAVQQVHDNAFDVEAVTSKFYDDYEVIFNAIKEQIRTGRGVRQRLTEERRHEFAQRLMNRLLFLGFLQKKKWLDSNPDYLFDLFAKCQEIGQNFYDDYLFYILFAGLNKPDNIPPDGMSQTELNRRIGKVPFLNGGLFEQFDEWDVHHKVEIGNDLFDKILGKDGLFFRYNFTVTESTPFDVEVAVDPEMLGKIFEELVTGRHETGSYYTPKPVVAFMCREALKGYLEHALPKESKKAVEQFIEETNPANLRDPDAVLEALRTVRACDPACGSGAYLLGLLHELLDLRACLFAAHQLDSRTIYDRKLEIIQSNLYGVDKDDFAVNIARLRLWLSLIVDFEGDVPPPLPNLNYKIETGDSLTAPDPSGGLEIGFRRQLVEDLTEAKKQFLTAHHIHKVQLHDKIEKIRADIYNWAGRAASDKTFDWTVEFAEIFVLPAPATTLRGAMADIVNVSGQMELAATPQAEAGFDIVLANPPYVRADAQFKHIEDEEKRQREIAKWKAYREQLKDSETYATLYEKWDLYIPFLERAYQLLQDGGQMVFIISDAYNAAKYASRSHEFFLDNMRIERIDFCSEIDLFDAGINNTILRFAKVAPTANHKPVRARRWGENRDRFDDNSEILHTLQQKELGDALFRPDGLRETNLVHGFVAVDRICYISVGMVINANERGHLGAFTTEEVLSETQDRIHPKRFVLGKDISKWQLLNIRYLEWGTRRAPKQFRRPTFLELHDAREKLLAMRTPGVVPKVIYDDDSIHFDASSVGFVPWHALKGVVNQSIRKSAKYRHQDPLGDREEREKTSMQFNLKYLLAITNSSYAREWLKGKRRSKMHVYPDDWKQLPVAPISPEAQKPFIALVDKILREYKQQSYPLAAASAEKVAAWERELDEMVDALYKSGSV